MSISIFEKEGRSDREYELFSRLLKDRIVFLSGTVGTQMANTIVAQLLFLDSDDNTKPIFMYINSPGGSVTAGLAIYDTMQYIKSPIHTVCVGMACSMGAVLLAGGSEGKRASLPNSEIMIHQPSIEGIGGQTTDVLISAEMMKRCRARLDNILAKHTKLPLKRIKKLTERDTWLYAEEAVSLGIIDKITKVSK